MIDIKIRDIIKYKDIIIYNMVNPKCKSCDTYISVVELKSSGEPFKSCKKCRELRKNIYKKKSIKKADEPDIKKEGKLIINDDMYEIKRKVIDTELAKKLIPSFGVKYESLEDMPDENEVIPDNCFKYVIGAKMTPEMMEKMGIRITKGDDEDNNIYADVEPVKLPDDIYPSVDTKIYFRPDSESD